jgi:hypothetical protein
MRRRQYLKTIGTASILVTTGCLNADNDAASEGSDNDDGSPESQTDEVDSSSDTETATQEGSDEFTRSPTSTVEQFYDLAVEARSPDSVEEFVNITEEMITLLHSQSPLRQRLERSSASPPDASELPDDNVSTETLETKIVYEDLDETTLREAYPELAEEEDSPKSLNPITASADDNVIVEATIDTSVAQSLGLSVTENWIVTIENSEWHLIK